MSKELIDIAIRIHIEPLKTVNHAAKVDTVIQVLTNISKSYREFLKIEFLKNIEFKASYEQNHSVLDTFIEDLDLLIVDLNFGSFEAALVPNLLNNQISLFNDDVKDFKKAVYEEYKNGIFLGNYNDINYIKNIEKRYTDKERAKIFYPLFHGIGSGTEYNLNVKDNNKKIIRAIKQPEKSKILFYTPKIKKDKENIELTTVNFYAQVQTTDDLTGLHKKNVKKILYYEKLEHDIYPFKPELIKFEENIFVLKQPLSCEVDYKDSMYFIKNNELDIVVWGETRPEVEEAFNFSFYSLYYNFYKENDKNLSEEAIVLKKTLKSIIKNVITE
jgi:hypothetical protein